jgi:hypothetical protein
MEDKISIEEKPQQEQKSKRRKMEPVEARQYYEMVLFVWVVLGWWFVRDAWFNHSESMLEHKGFNTVGSFGSAIGILYAGTRFLWAAFTVMRQKIDAATDRDFVSHETKRWWICVVLCAVFALIGISNKDIERWYNIGTTIVLIGFTAWAFFRWRKAQLKGTASQQPGP